MDLSKPQFEVTGMENDMRPLPPCNGWILDKHRD